VSITGWGEASPSELVSTVTVWGALEGAAPGVTLTVRATLPPSTLSIRFGAAAKVQVGLVGAETTIFVVQVLERFCGAVSVTVEMIG